MIDLDARGGIRKAIRAWLAEHGPHNITAIAAGIGIAGDVRVAGVLHSMRTVGMAERDAEGTYSLGRDLDVIRYATDAERIEARRENDRKRKGCGRRAQGMASRPKNATQAKRVLGGILGPHAAERATGPTVKAESVDDWMRRTGKRPEVLPVKWAANT